MINIIQPILPIFTTLLAVLITNLPFFNKFYYIDLAIPFIIIWIIRKPHIMRFIYVFVLGIVADVISNVTMGIHSFVYLMIWAVYLYFKKQQFTRTNIGVNITAVVIIILSYIYYGFFAYFNGTLQTISLLIGMLFTILISVFLNIMLLYRYVR